VSPPGRSRYPLLTCPARSHAGIRRRYRRSIEIKLVAELHEAYGMPAAGTPAEQMTAYAGAWADRRAVTTRSSGLTAAGRMHGPGDCRA
jgi:hypothetical protein